MSDVLVLCYHALSERWPAMLAVTPDQLVGHLSLLTRRGYRGVTFSEAVAGPSAARTVAITFDDAYRSVISLARPILREAGFVATVFAPTAYIGRADPMSWPGIHQWLTTEHRDELLPMSWDDLETLAADGWEIGSHTCSHPHLPELDPVSLDAELGRSRAEIEDRLGRCRSLAYPFGDYDERAVEAAERAGYSAAGTLSPRMRSSGGGLDCRRIGIYRGDGARRFRLKASPLVRRMQETSAWRCLTAIRRRARQRPSDSAGGRSRGS